MSEESLESRLVELESKLAYMEENLNQVNLTMFEQSKTIDRLKTDLKEFSDRIIQIETGMPRSDSNEKPPHY